MDGGILHQLASDVGNTSLYKATKLGQYLGFNRLYLKLEGENPSGTQKDRAAVIIIEEVIRNKYLGVTVGTCGNLGVAIARLCQRANLPCRIFIPKRYKGSREDELVTYGAKVTFTPGSYEEAVEASEKYAYDNDWYNANPSGPGGKLSIRAYEEIVNEIIEDLIGFPSSVWVPVGNGTTLTGIYQGFVNKGKVPRLGAVSSFSNNAIIKSVNAWSPLELNPNNLIETPINEPLLNWKSYQVNEALKAISNSRGWAYGATDDELINASKLIKQYERIVTHPASAASLSGFMALAPLLSNRKPHVLVLTS